MDSLLRPGILLCLLSLSQASNSDILLAFKSTLFNASQLATWTPTSPPCRWPGVVCTNQSIRALRLEHMGLSGDIDVGPLRALTSLRSISFINNSFDGNFPILKTNPNLRALYLSHNQFSGAIPDDAFLGLNKLRKVVLSDNNFTGHIPYSLTTLPKLLDLRLDSNCFTGRIPDFKQRLRFFNVSNNKLTGAIPVSLSKNNAVSFSGNGGLCGEPLDKCKAKSLFDASCVTIIIVAAIALVGIVIAIIIICRRKTASQALPIHAGSTTPSNFQTKLGYKESNHSASASPENKKKLEGQKLSFVREGRDQFDLPDLLKASAEVIASGCFGSSYKAALPSGLVMVVKRYKQMNNVGKEELQEHMNRLGRLNHPNLLPLIAYYYKKEEKLIITDYISNGSLAYHLHGGKGKLDWAKRLRIVKGVVKGLAYLYKELPSIISPHGHLKSSNVLLSDTFEPLLADYGLVPVINNEEAQELMVAYKSPEYAQLSRITKKTDVWSFGMLILELMTGKFPTNFIQKGKGNEEEDLAQYVLSVPREKWSSAVIDKDIRGTGSEEDMMKLLDIALICCEANLEKRPEIKEVVKKIEDIKEPKEKDTEEFFATCTNEVDLSYSR